MKQKYKIMLTCLCAILLVAASVLGTLAYLSDRGEVNNTMTFGKVDISLDEAKVTAEGKLVDGAERVTENTYHLIPGQTYIKDPIVTVEEGSEACFVFVKIENGIAAIEEDEMFTTIADQISQLGWATLEGVDGVYFKKINKEDASSGEELPVFTFFVIDDEVDNETFAQYKDAEINVKAYAIQQTGFETAKAAWDAANFS